MKRLSRLTVRIFLSYMSILLLSTLILTSYMLYNIRMQRVRDNIVHCQEQTDALVSLLDQRFLGFQALSVEVSQMSWVWKLASAGDVFKQDFTPVMQQDTVSDFQIVTKNDGILSDLIMFFPQKDIAISSRGWFSSIDQYFRYIDSNQSQLKEALCKKYNYDVLFHEQLLFRGHPVIWVVNSTGYTKEPCVQTAFCFNQTLLNEWIQNIVGDQLVSLVISGKNGEELTHYSTGTAPKKHLYTVDIPAKAFGWQYHLEMDTALYLFSTKEVVLLIVSLFVILIVGPLMATLLTYISYRPLQRLLSHVLAPSENRGEPSEQFNEYGILEDSFVRLMDENTDIKARVAAYQEFVRHDLFLLLLKGYFRTDQNPQELSYYGINYTDHNHFCVLLAANKPENGQREIPLEQLASRLLDALSQNTCHSSLAQVLDEGIAVIFSDLNDSFDWNSLEEFRKKLVSILPVDAWLGRVESRIIGISKSYHFALEQRFAQAHGETDIDWKARQQKICFFYPTDWQNQMVNGLKLGKADLVHNILQEIHDENVRRDLSYHMERQLLFLLHDTVLRAAEELGVKSLEERSEADNQNEWEWLGYACTWICGRFSGKDDDKAQLGEQILSYTQLNFCSPELSLKDISEEFDISVAVASKIFKQETNVNFIDFICRLRIEKAKELLLKENLPVRVLCLQVGYENDYSFRRAFQRYEGVSFTDYRDQILKKHQI